MMVPLMLMCTARPEFKAPWPMRSHHTQITLNRLSARAVREMVALVAARNALASENVEAVIERTGGVPLFVEELTRAMLESGTGKLTAHEIPVTLHDSLMARLDRLGSAKDVLQVGSVIGSEFSYGLLRAVHPASEQELERELRKLTDADLLYFRGIAPDATYQFKHALIRDTAYEALLKTRRRELHSRIAQILDISFTQIAAAHPELLGHHYTEAGLSTQAIPYWQRAGQQAVERSANVEAISHLSRGLELIKALPDAADHAAEELKIQIALGVPLGITKGYASPESQAVYERARELCEQVGETQQLGQVLWALWRLHHVRAEFQRARELGEELLTLAQRNHDRDLLLQAHHALWTTLILLGEFVLAGEHLEQGMAIYDPEQHRSHAFLYGGHDPGACCRGQRGYVLWYLGYPEQAMKSAQEAIALAQKLSHPYSLVMMLECATMIDQLCRNVLETQERAETVVALAREQGFPVWSALATLYHGWALAQQGLEKEGASELHQGMAAYRASGAGLGLPYQLARLAEVYERMGQAQEGLSALREALAATEKTGDRRWAAELYRLKGVLTLQSPHGSPEGSGGIPS
jgi:predicted ATPase